VNGEPKIYETAVIPVALAPGLDRYTAELNGSLYALMAERYGLEDQAEEQYLEVASTGLAWNSPGAPAAPSFLGTGLRPLHGSHSN
jgi:hypothetical protein